MEEQWNPKNSWWRFRLEAEAAKNYNLSSGAIGPHYRNVLLEEMLPTLLYIKATTLLDDSFELWLNMNDHTLSKPYKNDLNGRIQYLGDKEILSDISQLHKIRKRRSDFAHEAEISCNWSELNDAIIFIESNLVSLELARPTQKLEFFYERTPKDSTDPKIAFSFENKYGVKENGKSVLEITNTVNVHRMVAG